MAEKNHSRRFLTVRNRILVILSAVLCILLTIFLLFIGGKEWTTRNVKMKYEKGKEQIILVGEWLERLQTEELVIWNCDGSPGITDQDLQTEEPEIYQSMVFLFESQDCQVINKYNHYVFFQFYSDLDHGFGVLYSTSQPQAVFETSSTIIEISDFGVPNVYFYSSTSK